jgi:hypothetical protein
VQPRCKRPLWKVDRLPSETACGRCLPSTNIPKRPTLASQGIDKNLANRAMTSKRVDADWVGNMHEVGLLLIGVGTAVIVLSLIALIWSMVPH